MNEAKFTPEQQAIVNKNWIDGKCPKECVGECDIENGFLSDQCRNCMWWDGYTGSAPGDAEFKI